MKKINLEETLFNSKFNGLTEVEKESIKNGLIDYTFDEILIAMKEACRQTLKNLSIHLETKENFSIFEL